MAVKYSTLEQKEPVILDTKEVKGMGVKLIVENLVIIEDNVLRHDVIKLGFHIFRLLLQGE